MSDLLHLIERAFAEVVFPGEDNLSDSTYGEEPAALRIEFRDKTDWRLLDAPFLDQAPEGWGTALSFFSAAALQFYLPAYLMADLRGELARSDPSFRLCFAVTPQAETGKIAQVWGGGTLGDHARRDFERFSAAQVSAIVAYLWWKLEAEPDNLVVEQALEHYWLERDYITTCTMASLKSLSPPPNQSSK